MKHATLNAPFNATAALKTPAKALALGLLAALLFFAAPLFAADHHDHAMPKKTPSHEMLRAMHAPMYEKPFSHSDNLDLNFIANMIPHHEGAVAAARFTLERSENQTIKTIAQNIINDQEKEIGEFKALLDELKTQKSAHTKAEVKAFNHKARADMKAMHKKMNAVNLTNSLERDFLLTMIPHHEGAVAASKQILEHTKNEKIKAIANNIISAQEREIKEFGEIVKSLK